MMRLSLLWIDKTRETWLQTGIAEYLKRIRRHMDVRVLEVKGVRHPGKMAREDVMNREAAAITRALPPGAYVAALDQKGRMIDSPGLAGFLTELEDRGARELALIVGGPFGLSQKVTSKADQQISLSRLTFTHEMARLILVEQLYRACTIRAGVPYHY